MAANISTKPVTSGSDLAAFVKLPWRLYQNDPSWVPPMLFDAKRRLSKKHNHFFGLGEAEYFLAWRGGTPAGRITAQFDRTHDEHWGGKTGMFGWFEAE